MNAFRVHLIRAAIISMAHGMIWSQAMMLYQIQVIQLSALQLVLAGTMLEITILLFEVPTGIIADVYSRRLSCLIGFFILSAAYLIQGAVPAFEAILFGHFLWGVGYTFTSGAYDAWLVDELGQDRAGEAFIRGNQVERIFGFLGMALGVVFGSIALHIPILIGAGLHLVTALFLLFTMPERGFSPTPREERTTFGKMAATFKDGLRVVRARPALLSVMGVGVFFGLFSEGWDRLWQTHLLTTFSFATLLPVPTIWLFAALDVIQMPLGLAGSEIIRRRVNTAHIPSVTRTVLGLTAVMVVSIILYGLSPVLALALVMMFAFNLARGLIHPLLQTWTNQHIDSSVRATVLSMQSQVDAIGQAVGGPPIGYVGNRSLRAAFVLSGVILSPALVLLRRVSRIEPQVEVAPEAIAGD